MTVEPVRWSTFSGLLYAQTEIKLSLGLQLTDWSDWTDCNKSCGIGEQTRHRLCDSGCSAVEESDLNETKICKQGNYVHLTSIADSTLCSKDENEDISDWAGADIQVCFSVKISVNYSLNWYWRSVLISCWWRHYQQDSQKKIFVLTISMILIWPMIVLNCATLIQMV